MEIFHSREENERKNLTVNPKRKKKTEKNRNELLFYIFNAIKKAHSKTLLFYCLGISVSLVESLQSWSNIISPNGIVSKQENSIAWRKETTKKEKVKNRGKKGFSGEEQKLTRSEAAFFIKRQLG